MVTREPERPGRSFSAAVESVPTFFPAQFFPLTHFIYLWGPSYVLSGRLDPNERGSVTHFGGSFVPSKAFEISKRIRFLSFVVDNPCSSPPLTTFPLSPTSPDTLQHPFT
jgi:hypothetical protein